MPPDRPSAPAAAGEVAGALRRAADVGPFFAVDLDAPDAPDAASWQPLAVLTDPAGAAARTGAVRGRLSAGGASPVDRRAAASVGFLDLVSRLVAPALATACQDGIVPVLRPATVRWQPATTGPLPLSFDGVTGTCVATVADAGRALREQVVDPVVVPLLQAVAATSVSPIVLRGDVASALAGAATVLTAHPAGRVLEPRAVVGATLAGGVLQGTGGFGPRGFRRASCCLIYRLSGGGLCGDCVRQTA